MWVTNLLKVLRATRGDLERIYGLVCEPKMAANAEMRPGPQYPLMSLIFGLTRKAQSSPVEPQEGQADRHCDVQTDADHDANILIPIVRILLGRVSWVRLKIVNRRVDLCIG